MPEPSSLFRHGDEIDPLGHCGALPHAATWDRCFSTMWEFILGFFSSFVALLILAGATKASDADKARKGGAAVGGASDDKKTPDAAGGNDTDFGPILGEVNPLEDEYWRVLGRLQREMPDARIARLWRVRNQGLRAYYEFHKGRLAAAATNGTGGGGSPHEVEVWHGTKNADPGVVYRDRYDGFMVQFAGPGLWGRGIYFAESSLFSDAYAYKPTASNATTKDAGSNNNDDRPGGAAPDEREMFLAKLLVGNAVTLKSDTTLLAPPPDPSKPGQRYHTVKGYCHVKDTEIFSNVYAVYENGRAYPQYLLRYYKGDLDRNRTPFDTLAEAKEAGALWQFLDNNGWANYRQAHQAALEAARLAGNRTVQVQTEQWSYEVDLQDMAQVNQGHANHKRRQVRRLAFPSAP